MEIDFDLPPIFDVYDDEDFGFNFQSTFDVYEDLAVDFDGPPIFDVYDDENCEFIPPVYDGLEDEVVLEPLALPPVCDEAGYEEAQTGKSSFLKCAHEVFDKSPSSLPPCTIFSITLESLQATTRVCITYKESFVSVGNSAQSMRPYVVGVITVSSLYKSENQGCACNLFDEMFGRTDLLFWFLHYPFDPGAPKVFDVSLHSISMSNTELLLCPKIIKLNFSLNQTQARKFYAQHQGELSNTLDSGFLSNNYTYAFILQCSDEISSAISFGWKLFLALYGLKFQKKIHGYEGTSNAHKVFDKSTKRNLLFSEVQYDPAAFDFEGYPILLLYGKESKEELLNYKRETEWTVYEDSVGKIQLRRMNHRASDSGLRSASSPLERSAPSIEERALSNFILCDTWQPRHELTTVLYSWSLAWYQTCSFKLVVSFGVEVLGHVIIHPGHTAMEYANGQLYEVVAAMCSKFPCSENIIMKATGFALFLFIVNKPLRGVKVAVTRMVNVRRQYRVSGITSQASRNLVFYVGDLAKINHVAPLDKVCVLRWICQSKCSTLAKSLEHRIIDPGILLEVHEWHAFNNGFPLHRFLKYMLISFGNWLGAFLIYDIKEALASMTYVGHVTVTTVTKEKLHGHSVGCVMEHEPKACVVVKGTHLMVEDLFYNMIAWKKTQQNVVVSYAKIVALLIWCAIYYINMSFACRKHRASRSPIN